MNSWRHFVDSYSQSSSPSNRLFSSIPTPLAALPIRSLRTTIYSLTRVVSLVLIVILLGGPAHTSLKAAYHSSLSRLTGGEGAVGWVPSWTTEDSENISSADPDWGGVREPTYTVDRHSRLEYPPNVNPMVLNNYKRAKATFVSLVRNEDLGSMMSSMRAVEETFNRKFGVSDTSPPFASMYWYADPRFVVFDEVSMVCLSLPD